MIHLCWLFLFLFICEINAKINFCKKLNYKISFYKIHFKICSIKASPYLNYPFTQQRHYKKLIKQLSKSYELVTLWLVDWGEFMHINHSTMNILNFLPIFEVMVPVRPNFWKLTPRKTALRSKFYFEWSVGKIEVWKDAKNCSFFFIENFRKFWSIFQWNGPNSHGNLTSAQHVLLILFYVLRKGPYGGSG